MLAVLPKLARKMWREAKSFKIYWVYDLCWWGFFLLLSRLYKRKKKTTSAMTLTNINIFITLLPDDFPLISIAEYRSHEQCSAHQHGKRDSMLLTTFLGFVSFSGLDVRWKMSQLRESLWLTISPLLPPVILRNWFQSASRFVVSMQLINSGLETSHQMTRKSSKFIPVLVTKEKFIWNIKKLVFMGEFLCVGGVT